MNTLIRHTARTALLGVAVGVLAVTASGSASGEPASRLPNADLVCGSTTLLPDQWVAVPQSDTVWVRAGALAGHYVILGDTHYVVPGYVEEPPATYDDLEAVDSRTRGAKQGHVGAAITCQFVSRWGEPGDPDTFSVIGPITMARVPG